jgi:hypothetical protein
MAPALVDKSKMPRVSLGLPVHNGGELLESAIQSVLSQTFRELELIISDNASDDGTESLCRRIADQDPRVRYYRSPTNIGAAANHNRVVELARGEYFKWVADDDLIEPTFVERCVAVLDADHAGRYVLCFSLLDYIDAVGSPISTGTVVQSPVFEGTRPHLRLEQFWESPRMHQVMYGVIRRHRLIQTRPQEEWYGSDRQMLVELALLGGFARVEEVLFHHREHAGRSDSVSDKSLWMTGRPGRPQMGYWRRVPFLLTLLQREYLRPKDRRAVLWLFARYAVVRTPHWLPRMTRELADLVAHRFRLFVRRTVRKTGRRG